MASLAERVRRTGLFRRAQAAQRPTVRKVGFRLLAAAHYARGAEPGDRQALELILCAAREAEAKQSHHEAVAHLLMAAGGVWAVAGRSLLLPVVGNAAAIVYEFVARHRHQLPGGTPACQLPEPEKS